MIGKAVVAAVAYLSRRVIKRAASSMVKRVLFRLGQSGEKARESASERKQVDQP